ncbi:unnamed protein product [Meganyctiphanes norvegica]|uniref:Uncharacterized protein n=1 Tax=Meganyctiphanes norvegica TaxID=48144 RepID=A0AAV2R488_MEGNR
MLPAALVVRVAIAGALLTLANASPTANITSSSHPDIAQKCNQRGNTHLCDFKDIETQIKISNIGDQVDNSTYYIINSINMTIKGSIRSKVRFTNSNVELNEASVCSTKCVKIEIKSETTVDRIPKDAQDIVISNSDIKELTSESLINAVITDSNINWINITSSNLAELTVSNSNISNLNCIDVPEKSVVTFINTIITEAAENNPFSVNQGILKLQSTPIPRPIHIEYLVKSSPSEVLTPNTKGPNHHQTVIINCLIAAVVILSVAVLVLGIVIILVTRGIGRRRN